MQKFSVQSLPGHPVVARGDAVPVNDSNAAETGNRGGMQPANDQVALLPMSDGDGISITSGPPDPPPDPDPDKKQK
jgi:hypothetical protein